MLFGTGVCKCGDNVGGWVRGGRGSDEGVEGKEVPEDGVSIGKNRWEAQEWRHGEKGNRDARRDGYGLFLR